MDKYIITFEDGSHYIADKITNEDLESLNDGIITIIRLSDGKQYWDEEWSDLPKWGE